MAGSEEGDLDKTKLVFSRYPAAGAARRARCALVLAQWLQSHLALSTETNDPLIADHRNFYKVEKWTKNGAKVDHMLYAGSNLDKAREVFTEAIRHRPRIRLTIRQRSQVLEQWPATAR